MIERWLSEIQAIERDARAVLDGLSPDQANRQPEPGKWSVAQCIAHVTVTAGSYLDAMEPVASGPANGRVRPGLLAALLVRSMEPPPRMRVRTLPRLEPAESHDPGAVLDAFSAAHERLARLIRTAENDEAFLCRRFRSPYMSIIRVRLDQGVAVLLAHARRHLWQARQARRVVEAVG